MKKILLSLIALACGMSMNAQTTGTATRTGGVSVKWVQLWENGPKFAEYNVGVTDGKAESYGGYYLWGSSIDQDSNNKYRNGSDALTGTDDTATNLWGSNWCMPTKAELEALLANCDVAWTKVNGVNGRKFTGKGDYASNSVFLPAAGYYSYDYIYGKGDYGDYWSSTANGSAKSYYVDFFSGNQGVSYAPRYYGYSVRAVLADNSAAIEGVVDNAINTVRGKKVINGGKLIIMGNDGKMYNTVGIEIKK